MPSVASFVRPTLDLVRGGLIGAAEIVPGVSGGTIALIVGVYDTLIDGAGHLARGIARLIGDGTRGRGVSRAAAHFRSVRWGVLLPVGVGMLVAIVVGARLLAPLLEEQPVATRAVFAGLIAASLIVPIRMVGGAWRPHEAAIALAAAVAAFILTGLPPAADADPSLPIVALAAAFAVCALVLPGVSGSYLLLTVGMYAPTLAAVNDRNLAYLGAFALGAIIGLGLFVSALQWLLANQRRLTLVVITGLMLGSLRALWPWQSADSELRPPGDDALAAVGLFAIGAVVVLAIIGLESLLVRRRLMNADVVSDPVPDGWDADEETHT
ncbi:putative membrane protein [Leifsonia sp. AK011]|uniref:DUF368 domain-containing protein n=1 Tax=Leifsonia sp. AK011 TaxID=2723075 RepID=UPI0015C9E1F6|nr:DUF368 domain-containing protein [Leifsonia sp. AK011]NYF10245.1 putative membrane protein [Leifsonia sp. AK011]